MDESCEREGGDGGGALIDQPRLPPSIHCPFIPPPWVMAAFPLHFSLPGDLFQPDVTLWTLLPAESTAPKAQDMLLGAESHTYRLPRCCHPPCPHSSVFMEPLPPLPAQHITSRFSFLSPGQSHCHAKLLGDQQPPALRDSGAEQCFWWDAFHPRAGG